MCARSIKKVIDYRTFGILLLERRRHPPRDETRRVLRRPDPPQADVPIGEGLVGYAALHKTPVIVADVTTDPRYIKVVEDVRSELVIPLLVKDRCIGVFDLESPEVGAFTKAHIELLTPLAASAAVAIENARLYDEIRQSQERLEKEVRFAQRVQQALFPMALPKRLKGIDVAWRFEPARELGGDLYDFLSADAEHAHRGRRRRVGQGRARGALQRVCRRTHPLAHLPPPLHAGTRRARPKCSRR